VHGLILAGGFGSRLAADGVPTAKATVSVGGVPQVVRLVRMLLDLDCSTVVCAVRTGIELPPLAIPAARPSTVTVRRCATPSPVHTLAIGLEALPPGPVFCTMVDTVMPDDDWRRVYHESRADLATGADAVVATTPYVDDDRALYVRCGAERRVTEFADEPGDPVLVTGGVYLFSDRARAIVPELVSEGVDRMRTFLRRLVARDLVVRAVTVPRIIDIDRADDLRAANALLGGAPPSAHSFS
jgi:NDP-sugar pyrophosphorylase family protein